MAQRIPLPLTVSCFSKIQIGFTFLVPAHPGCPGQRAVKRVCVYVLFTGPATYVTNLAFCSINSVLQMITTTTATIFISLKTHTGIHTMHICTSIQKKQQQRQAATEALIPINAGGLYN